MSLNSEKGEKDNRTCAPGIAPAKKHKAQAQVPQSLAQCAGNEAIERGATRTSVGASRRATRAFVGASSGASCNKFGAFNTSMCSRARRPSEQEHEDVTMAPPPLRRYGLHRVMEKEGKKWFKEHKEYKYSHDKFIHRNCFSLVFSHMVDRILSLGLGFMFNAPSDGNLNMVREFLANWMPKERSNQVKTKGKIIEFSPKALNRLLGTPNVDPQPFVDLVKKPPYRNIRHTLCGPNSIARWTRHQ
ncbi:hypothetical protein HAX54_019858 [Datura stramonium]|uniref:Putative plant transposon protein domain-containing protein n=1 Tax=Datura stramonium TaxID=4076 RepID=A0ABS8US88_DATST|nr:hypothetical protein [Datura stramonium]